MELGKAAGRAQAHTQTAAACRRRASSTQVNRYGVSVTTACRPPQQRDSSPGEAEYEVRNAVPFDLAGGSLRVKTFGLPDGRRVWIWWQKQAR
jgi:hypothetical protein